MDAVMTDVKAFFAAFVHSMLTRFAAHNMRKEHNRDLLEAFSLLDPNTRRYNRGRYQKFIATICAVNNNYNFTGHSEEALLLSCSKWLAQADVYLKPKKDMDIIKYFHDLKQSEEGAELQAICDLALCLLAFLPTSVICEDAFSRYNATMRSDRTSMDDSLPEAYLIMQSSSVTCEEFEVHHVKHLYKHIVRSGDGELQVNHLKAATKASRLLYASDGQHRKWPL